MKQRALTAMDAPYGPRRFHNLHGLVLFHNRGFPVGRDRCTSHHAGQEIYTVLLPNVHGRSVPFGKAPRGILDELRPFLLGANMEVDDEDFVIYSKRVYDCLGWLSIEDVMELTDDLEVKVFDNPRLKDLESVVQGINPPHAHPLLAIPAFLHHNLGFLRVSVQLIVYNMTNNGTLNEVLFPQTAMYDLEGPQATVSSEPPDLDITDSFVEPEATVLHLALRADRTFNPRACAVCSMRVPTDFVLVSDKPSIIFERHTLDDLIEGLLSRQFTPDTSMALTQFLCKKGVIVGEQRETIEVACDQSPNDYTYEELGNYGEDVRIVKRTSIYDLICATDRESTADTMDIDGIFN